MERNCSVQRRHQKLIEEAPSPCLGESLRGRIHDAAIRIAERVRYRNAGTVEFLEDANGNFYFMEINARIQVEHPATEAITGIDLIKAQLAIASGDGLRFTQSEIAPLGHAIECRINAEDPACGFLPSPGRVEQYHAPGGFGVRFDTHLYPGYEVPVYYDSLLGKLIAFGRNRADALQTIDRALRELVIEPLSTTKDFLLQVIHDHRFVRGDYRLDLVADLLGPEVDEEG
jgi:acetyl-CoA carboxylase, biotin carboxylase subunit